MSHPVQVHFEHPVRTARIHVLIRFGLLIALGGLGGSSLYWALYVAIPAIAAIGILQRGASEYQRETAKWMRPIFQWLVGAYGYLWFLSDDVAIDRLTLETSGTPTASSALLRWLTSLPALLMLVVLSVLGCVLWIVAAVVVVVRERPPAAIADFFALTLRYQFRLLAYHLCLVDRYPSLEDAWLSQEIRT